jgi:hypothetical protein
MIDEAFASIRRGLKAETTAEDDLSICKRFWPKNKA